MRPVVDRLYEEYGDRVHFAILNPETDADAARIADEHQVRFVPTFVFVDSDGNVVETMVGEVAEGDIAQVLETLE